MSYFDQSKAPATDPDQLHDQFNDVWGNPRGWKALTIVNHTTIGLRFLITGGVFFLIAEHRAHLLGWLPWLIILACPLLHIFMHRSHGGHDHGGSSSSRRSDNPPHQH